MYAKVATLVSSVLRFAKSLLTGRGAKPANMKLLIEGVKRLKETADVWDITVPDGHWFSLSNGAVVHNSDAFGMAAVIYETPQKQETFKIERSWVV